MITVADVKKHYLSTKNYYSSPFFFTVSSFSFFNVFPSLYFLLKCYLLKLDGSDSFLCFFFLCVLGSRQFRKLCAFRPVGSHKSDHSTFPYLPLSVLATSSLPNYWKLAQNLAYVYCLPQNIILWNLISSCTVLHVY